MKKSFKMYEARASKAENITIYPKRFSKQQVSFPLRNHPLSSTNAKFGQMRGRSWWTRKTPDLGSRGYGYGYEYPWLTGCLTPHDCGLASFRCCGQDLLYILQTDVNGVSNQYQSTLA